VYCLAEEINMTINLPVQSPPVHRADGSQGALENQQGHQANRSWAGVQAAQTPCDGLTGLAQQMCYAVLYSV
jgi:hypothetical protein